MDTLNFNKASRQEIGLAFMEALREEMIFAEHSGNHGIIQYYLKSPRLYVNRLRHLSFDSKLTCFWCEHQITRVKRLRSHLYNHWRIDYVRDLNKKGPAGAISNQVLSCRRCYTTRYSQDSPCDIESWLDSCRERKGEKHYYRLKHRVDLKLSNPRTHSDWIAYERRLKDEIKGRKKKFAFPKEFHENQRKAAIGAVPNSSSLGESGRIQIAEKLLLEAPHCVWCSRDLDKAALSLDHLLPKSLGGSHWYCNLLPTCADCNHSRNNILASDFLKVAKNPDREFILLRLYYTKTDPRRRQKYFVDNKSFYDSESNKQKVSRYLLDSLPFPVS